MDSNLLKEAIADAKAVRQTALANAKAALEEAFGNRLEAMLTPKLEEETADVIGGSLPPPPQDVQGTQGLEQEAVVNETDIEQIIRELEAELPQDGAGAPPLGGAGAPPPMGDPMAAGAPPVGGAPAPCPAPAPMGAPLGAPPVGAPPVGGAPAPMGDPMAAGAPQPPVPQDEEGMDEEIDVNELLESLKNEEDEEDEDKEKGNKPPWLKENAPVGTSGIAGSDNKKPSSDASATSHLETAGKDRVGGGEGYKGGVADATTAKRPNQAKNATKTNLSTPGGKLKENTGGSTPGYPEGAKKTSTGDDATEATRPNAGPVDEDNMSTPALTKENTELKSQLNEAEQALTYLRGQLNEINLLNAKLLYTNRLFKEYSMDNGKKMKIVEMFDLAKNVREVKMTYAVIAESLNFGADFKRKERIVSSAKVQNITEGMASKPVAGTAPRQIIAESAKSEMVSKFQKLAGIKTPVVKPTTK